MNKPTPEGEKDVDKHVLMKLQNFIKNFDSFYPEFGPLDYKIAYTEWAINVKQMRKNCDIITKAIGKNEK